MLDRKMYFIRERVAFMKLTDTYDIFDPAIQMQIGIAKERPGTVINVLRLVVNRQFLPTKVFVYKGTNPDDESVLLFSIQRGFSLLRSKVSIFDVTGNLIGWFRSKAFSLGGAFYVFDSTGNEFAKVQGDWKGWNFIFTNKDGKDMGSITKKWAGIGKEMFTSADNYMISLNEARNERETLLLLAAGLAVDTVFKE
jgi:uncharacterized protein YxjI